MAGSIDFSANAGFSSLTGVDGKKHPEFGASAGINLTKYVELAVDYGATPLGSVTLSGTSGSANLQLFGASLRAALDRSKRAIPYAVLGGGLADLHGFASLSKVLSGTTYQTAEEYTEGGSYLTLGGGVSLYVRHNWGVRPEFRYQREHFSAATANSGYSIAASSENNVQGLVSVFLQFGGN